MHAIWQDVKYGLRGVRKQPGFAALAVLTLGLGIGAATTIFSVIQNVLLDPYPYAHVERNVTLEIRDAARPDRGGQSFFRLPEFLDYHEIGIRIALGAQRADVIRMVLWLGVRLAGSGIAIGVLASFAATRVLGSQLFGVTPTDPVTLAGVAAVVATASLVASYLPARRATAVDPMESLRHE